MSATQERREPRLACMVCRQRKVACDRQRPRCSLCIKHDFQCEYKSNQRRPGLRAGYVSRLESQLNDVCARLKQVEVHLTQFSSFTVDRSSASMSSRDNHHFPSDQFDPDLSESPNNHSTNGEGGADHSGFDAMAASIMVPECEHSVASDAILYPLANDALHTWFQKYYPWFPILHQSSFPKISASTSPHLELVWKAVTAVVIIDQSDASSWDKTRAVQLRDQVMHQSLAVCSLQSIQALLILSNHFYALGRFTEFWNVMAACKRMLLHPRLQSYASRSSSNYTLRAQAAQEAPKVGAIEQEEATRAFWMVEMLDAISTLGLPHYKPYLQTPLSSNLPCLESQWSPAATTVARVSAPDPRYSSSFTLCVVLAVDELRAVREFLDKPCQLDRLDQRLEWQSEAQRLDERLTNWREEFVAAVFQLINYEKDYLPRGEMDSFFILTNCVLNTAIIVLLQQMAPMPKEITTDFEPWAFATTRCTYACENLTAKVRRIGADELESESPHLIMPIFVAARFYVVYSKALDANVPANLHTLAFILHSCSKRWPLAQLYETIIRTAVAEHRSPISQCVLPVEFYDLRYTSLEIMDLLQQAVLELPPP